MEAERLVALEAALAELGGLYTAARNFAALERRADDELLPRLTRFAAHLRAIHRSGGFGERDIDEASKGILELRAQWQSALEDVHQSALFNDARGAFERDDQGVYWELDTQSNTWVAYKRYSGNVVLVWFGGSKQKGADARFERLDSILSGLPG